MSTRSGNDYVQINKSDFFPEEAQQKLDEAMKNMFPAPLDHPREVRMLTLYNLNDYHIDDAYLAFLFTFRDDGDNLWMAYLSHDDPKLGLAYLIAQISDEDDRQVRHGIKTVKQAFLDARKLKLIYENEVDPNNYLDYENNRQILIDRNWFPMFMYNPHDTLPFRGHQLKNLVPAEMANVDVW